MDQTQKKQLTEALVQVALLESRDLAVHFAEIIAYLQKGNHLAALGTFRGLDEQFTFLGTVLEAAARLSQQST